MNDWFAVALGGALGAMARYGLSLFLPQTDGNFPWAIFVANVLGCMLVGMVYFVVVEKISQFALFKPMIMIGFLGAFTTFSTFSLESIRLWQQGYTFTSVLYCVSTVVVCFTATVSCLALVRRFF